MRTLFNSRSYGFQFIGDQIFDKSGLESSGRVHLSAFVSGAKAVTFKSPVMLSNGAHDDR